MIKPTDFVRRQHTTPRTYLKHFSSKNKVCLYHLNNQYKRTIQENINIGNGKIFGGYEEFYYDFPNKNNIQFLEKSVFKKWEDNDYNLIIKTITERAGAIHCKNILLNWIAMMKIRSGSFRDNYTRLFYFLNKAVFDLSKKNKDNGAIFEDTSKEMGKAFQLSSFLKHYDTYIKSYKDNFCLKKWIILEIVDDSEFITSDNPGFSFTPSTSFIQLKFSPLSSYYNLDNNDISFHYFPLTSKQCLCIHPLNKMELLEAEQSISEFISKDFDYIPATFEQIDFINKSTIKTANKLVVSKNKNVLKNLDETIKTRFT